MTGGLLTPLLHCPENSSRCSANRGTFSTVNFNSEKLREHTHGWFAFHCHKLRHESLKMVTPRRSRQLWTRSSALVLSHELCKQHRQVNSNLWPAESQVGQDNLKLTHSGIYEDTHTHTHSYIPTHAFNTSGKSLGKTQKSKYKVAFWFCGEAGKMWKALQGEETFFLSYDSRRVWGEVARGLQARPQTGNALETFCLKGGHLLLRLVLWIHQMVRDRVVAAYVLRRHAWNAITHGPLNCLCAQKTLNKGGIWM